MAEGSEVVPYQPPAQPPSNGAPVLDNRTDLPDQVVAQAVMDHWTEVAGLQFGATPSSFQLYSNNAGSMLARTPFRTPSNVIDEIKLARSIADTDDDVAATIGGMLAYATRDGIRQLHQDEKTLGFFGEIAKPGQMGLMRIFKEMYREWLISSQVITLSLFTRSRLKFYPTGSTDAVTAQLATPLVGVLPAENFRVVSNDLLGQGALAYKSEDNNLTRWLEEFFGDRTTAARKAEMARQEPVAAALFTGRVVVPWNDSDLFSAGQTLYTVNPRMVHRTTMAKGAAPYPRPLLTRNFALLEAKRLLNIMDYALLQGGTNYIVVARKGSDALPAQQPEIDNLVDQVRTASRSGVMVGDHRLSIEIITPKLDELLNPAKRKLIGRKLAMALLRIPEQVTGDPGQAGAAQEQEATAATIMSDRADLFEHLESHVYEETANRNRASFPYGAPALWSPRIILGSNKDFWASVVQARDRGDIPRRWAVEMLGFDYDAGIAERKREIERGDDEVLTPGSVPFTQTSGGQGPPGEQDPYGPRPGGSGADNGGGRPSGTGGNGRGSNQPAPPDPAQRTRRRGLSAVGEVIRATWDEEHGAVRVGELTARILEEYPDFAPGRLTSVERESVEANAIYQEGPIAVIPVNPAYAVEDLRVFRLDEGLSMVVGQRRVDHALVAKALCFREPHWTVTAAEDTALRWGFSLPPRADEPPEEEHAAAVAPPLDPTAMAAAMAEAMAKAMASMPAPNVTVHMPQANGVTKVVKRDEHGNIVGVEEIPTPAES